MNVSKKIKVDASKNCCSPELILSLLEQQANAEDGEKALLHLANCPECRQKAAFVCQALAAEKDGTFPVLSQEERRQTLSHVDELLKKNDKNGQHILWELWIKNNNCLSFLKEKSFEPEVLAAARESSELYFRSTEPRSSKYFWQAALCIEDGTEEMLKVVVTDGEDTKIPVGDFLLCLVKTTVKDGVCFVNREKFAENLFSNNKDKHFVALRFADGTVKAGLPVLGAIM